MQEENNHGSRRGRKKNETYTRRTDAEIRRDKIQKQQQLTSRRQSFFAPRMVPPPTTPLLEKQQAEEFQGHDSTIIKEGNIKKNPLPGVDMHNVPPLLREPIGKVMGDLRSKMKASTPQSNQFQRFSTGSQQFPWRNEEYQWPNPLMLSRPPTAIDFVLPKFGRLRFFAPDKTCPHLLPTSQMPCKWHGHKTLDDGHPCTCRDLFFNNFVRPFDDADGTRGFLFSSRYYCRLKLGNMELNKVDTDVTDHAYYFAGHDPEVLKFLTSEVRGILGLVVTKRRAITQAFSNRIIEDVAAKCSFHSIHKKTSILRNNLLPRIQRDIDAYQNNKAVAGSLVKMHNLEHEKALRWELCDVVGEVPSPEFIEKHFVLCTLKLLPYYERCLQLVSGCILCGDKSYKVIKFIFVPGADGNMVVRAFDSVYTIMNEFNQVVAINFTRAGDYDEVEEILKGINHRYKIHGFETVRLFYTDSCCHEYNMLLRALPSLGKLDPARDKQVQSPQLPPAQLPLVPIMVASWNEFVSAVTPFLEAIDCSSSMVPIGLDIEWDSLSAESRQRSFPEIIQLAINEPPLQRVIVVSIRRTFPEMIKDLDMNGSEYYAIENVEKWCTNHNLLFRLLTNPKTVLVGVGVEGDLTRLRKNFPESFVGSKGSHKVCDCATIAERNGLLFSKQKRSLSALIEFFLALHLDKRLARSMWSSQHLPQELINYAALDAWMSLMLYNRIITLSTVHRKPTKEELQQNPFVRLLASRSNVVIAFAQVNNGTTVDLLPNGNVKVKVVTIIDGSAKVPKVSRQANGAVTVADAYHSGQLLAWPHRRMTLSSESDLQSAQRFAPNMSIDSNSINIHERSNRDSHRDSHAVDQLDVVLDDGDLDLALQHAGVLPDETTLASYPDRPIQEGDDCVDFVLVVQQENGTIARHEGNECVFERNGVKGDPFHYLKRLFDTWKKSHGFNTEARGLVRDAILIPNPDQVNALLPVLASKLAAEKDKKWSGDNAKSLDEAQRRLMCPSAKLLRNIERLIPSPTILEERLTSVVKFIANVKDHKTGEPLFSKESWKVYRQLMTHIRKGCVSDEKNVNYYYYTTKPNGRQVLHCCRGTSQLEGFHRHLRDILKATHSSPLLAVCLLSVFVHRWNHDRATERSIISERYRNYYEHEVIHDMQISADLTMQEQFFGDLLNPNDFVSTGETSYTPIVRRALQLIEPSVQEDDPELAFINEAMGAMARPARAMETNIEMNGERTTDDIPVTKMTADDCTLFNELLAKYQESPTETRSWATNYEKMCIEHNARALDESYLPIGTRKRIFAKTVPILKAYHKELKARDNMRRTERQIVRFFDRTSQTTHATTVKRAVPQIREQMKVSTSSLPFKIPLQQPPDRQEPMASAVQDPSDRTILFVPPPELYKANAITTKDGPSHILMPPVIGHQASTVTREELNDRRNRRSLGGSQRCYRCGWARVGEHHKKRVATNTVEYCTTPQEERYPYWEVPYGYNVSDSPTTVRSDNMKKRWRRIMEENNIEADPRFPDWNPKISRTG
jgi:hypothetical protein